jgi:hypothetical protein
MSLAKQTRICNISSSLPLRSPMSAPAIELAENSLTPASAVERTVTTDADDFGNEVSQDLPSLPPVDGGSAAARFLLGAFLIEALLWGTFPCLAFSALIDI